MTESNLTVELAPEATRSKEFVARASLALAMTLVGSTVVSAKFIADQFPILVALGIRHGTAVLIMLAIVLILEGRIPRISGRNHMIIILQTLTGVVIFNILLLVGVDLTTAAASGIILSILPATIAVLSLALGERISRLTVYGIGLAMIGVLIVNLAGTESGEDGASRPILGGLLVFGAVIAEALFTIIGKALVGRVTPIANCFMVCVYGAMVFVPIAIWQWPGFDARAVKPSGWIALAWWTGPVMILAFFLWFNGLKTIPANAASVYTGLVPVSAVFFSGIFLGEYIGLPHVVGMACVIAAIVLVARSDRRVQPDAAMVAQSRVPR
jgi:drug/metabolite transporter (DMT)-like permease